MPELLNRRMCTKGAAYRSPPQVPSNIKGLRSARFHLVIRGPGYAKKALKLALGAMGMTRVAARTYMRANSSLRSLAYLAGRGQREIRRYLDVSEIAKLHLGCGYHILPGWLNTDLKPRDWSAVRVDVTEPLLFPPSVFDFVFSEHLVEHLPYESGEQLLRECFRVMKPGGLIRTATPDLSFVVGLYETDHSAFVREYLDYQRTTSYPRAPRSSDTFFINNFVRNWGHRFIYDEKTLRELLHTVGFVDVIRCDVGQSEHPELKSLENVDRMPHGYVELETMVLEARKPNPQ